MSDLSCRCCGGPMTWIGSHREDHPAHEVLIIRTWQCPNRTCRTITQTVDPHP